MNASFLPGGLPRFSRAASRKCASGSTRSTSWQKGSSSCCVTRPMPAPQSATTRRPAAAAWAPTASIRKDLLSATSAPDTLPYPWIGHQQCL